MPSAGAMYLANMWRSSSAWAVVIFWLFFRKYEGNVAGDMMYFPPS